MSMSIAMAAGMNALVGINSQLQDLQAQALSGKKINNASDGLAAYLSSQTYTDRANRLTSINSTLSQNLSTIKSASQGLSSISKTINDTLDQLKTASQTQAQVIGSGGYNTTSGDSITQSKMTISATTGAGGAVAVNAATNLVNGNNNIYMGGQKLTAGNVYTFAVNGVTKSIRISATTDTQPTPGVGDQIGSTTTPYYVKTVQDIMNVLSGFNSSNMTPASQGYLGVSSAIAGNNLTVNLQLNGITQPDNSVTGSMGLSVASYAAGAITGDVSQMMTATRAAGAPNTSYSYDAQTNGGTAGTVGQSVSIAGTKNTYTAGTGAIPADTKRAAAASAYQLALKAIDQYLKDASVSGINLLNGDSLLATFNEKGTSTTIQMTNSSGAAASYGSTGLGLVNATGAQDYAANFAVNIEAIDQMGNPVLGLQSAINKLTTAQTTLQLGVAQVGQFQNMVQNRSDFNMAIIGLLNDSANNLTAADMSSVAAQTAALQVQQSFAQTILASTKQSDQSVLQLLR